MTTHASATARWRAEFARAHDALAAASSLTRAVIRAAVQPLRFAFHSAAARPAVATDGGRHPARAFALLLCSGLALTAALPARAADDSIVRIESANYAGYVIRHQDLRGRLDRLVNPIQDSQFRLVPGLADANAVSIESVNFPGRFLRHRQGGVWLDTNDGSAPFKADATWLRRTGLADVHGVSFESFNGPGQYIRHRDNQLWREAVNTPLDRQDATFVLRKNTVAYLMGGFKESPNGSGNDYGLHIAYSLDALNWVPLNEGRPVMRVNLPGHPGIRDPYFLRKADGSFVMLGTRADWNMTTATIFATDTSDFVNFTNHRTIRLSPLNNIHGWAPEAYWDAARGKYAIIWSGNPENRNRLYVNYTDDFVSVDGPQTFFDPGVAVIDGDVYRFGTTDYMYYKDETDHFRIKGTRSATLNPMSWVQYTQPIQHGNKDAEGPNVIRKINENRWLMYTDSYQPNGVLYAFETNNIAGGVWKEVDRRTYTPPQSFKHTTIVELTQNELDRVVQAWGQPAYSRLKSYNFPFSWIRHQENVGKLSEEPFDPADDSQWKLVPGLADPAAVSFESKAFPGRYLRHFNYALRLEASDGSNQFKADASFYRVAGLANGGWSSFRSLNVANHYIRHQEGLLRISPIASELDRQDATFLVTH